MIACGDAGFLPPQNPDLASRGHAPGYFQANSREFRPYSPQRKPSSAHNHRFFATTSDPNHLRLLPSRHRPGAAPTTAAKSSQPPWSKRANCRGENWPTAVAPLLVGQKERSPRGAGSGGQRMLLALGIQVGRGPCAHGTRPGNADERAAALARLALPGGRPAASEPFAQRVANGPLTPWWRGSRR